MDTNTTTTDQDAVTNPGDITHPDYQQIRSEWIERSDALDAEQKAKFERDSATYAENLAASHNKEQIVGLAKATFTRDEVSSSDTKIELCEALGEQHAWDDHRTSDLYTQIENAKAGVRVFERIESARQDSTAIAAMLASEAADLATTYASRSCGDRFFDLSARLAATEQTASLWTDVANLIIDGDDPVTAVRKMVYKTTSELDVSGPAGPGYRGAYESYRMNGVHEFLSDAAFFMEW